MVCTSIHRNCDLTHSAGRVFAKRTAGNRLVFIDVVENGQRLQALCNFKTLTGYPVEKFKAGFQEIQRGDIVRMLVSRVRSFASMSLTAVPGLIGKPHITLTSELSILLSKFPEVLSPCKRRLPMELHDPETRIRNRSTDFLVNEKSTQLIRIRSSIIQYIRQFLLKDDQIEVQTPILAGMAGGAVARPFVTAATEFPARKISLRIAPELWLKRMVIGGFDRVFEIGPAFRNEGTSRNVCYLWAILTFAC